MEARIAHEIVNSPAKVDLIEEGGFQAARALSDDRIHQIVNAVAEGISQEDSDVIRRMRLLSLLAELDDDESTLLYAHGQSMGGGGRLKLNYPPRAHLNSSEESRGGKECVSTCR